MADKLMRAQVLWQPVSANPEDVVTNTWYFDGDDPNDPPGPSDADYHAGVVSLLNAFYGAVAPYMSDLVFDNPAIRIYDMRDPEPRLPEYVGNLTVDIPANATNARLPEEVALVLSFKAALESGQVAARRRGRVYLGPFRHGVSEYTDNRVRPIAALKTAVVNAANTMKNGYGLPLDQGDVQWAIYSRTTDLGGANLDDSFHDVVGGWVDNAWDTQRRRGPEPSARTTFGTV